MIDIEEVMQLIKLPESKNIFCRIIEFRPRNLAIMIATLSNLEESTGYIVIGASKSLNNYCIDGISAGFKLEKALETALTFLSVPPKIEWVEHNINGKKIYIIKVIKIEADIFIKDISPDTSKADIFIRDLYLACAKLQSRKIYVTASEDERNDHIGDLLETSGYAIKDQTRRGVSATGKSSGEVDILVHKDNMPFTIIEALNLSNLDTTYISTHLNKIYTYDTLGHQFNVCLIYLKSKNFVAFWEKYCLYAKSHKYPVELLSIDTNADNDYPFSEIRFIKTTHIRSGKETDLYHMCVRIHDHNS